MENKYRERLKSFTYDEWRRRLKDILLTRYNFTHSGKTFADEVDRRMRDDDDGWLFFGSDHLVVIRGVLDALPDTREVILDISDLVHGGYIGENERILRAAANPRCK